MNFYPILPTKYLGRLGRGFKHHMVLAHLLVDPAYRNYYKSRVKMGHTVILDNGSCELGKPIPNEKLFHYWDNLRPAVIVLPDALSKDNLTLFREGLDYLMFSWGGRKASKIMAVPHDVSEIEQMAEVPEVDIIGLNRDFQVLPGGRAKIIRDFQDCGKMFHLLGVRKNPLEEALSVRYVRDVIIGIDTSIPYRIARRGGKLEEYKPYPHPIDFGDNGLENVLLSHIAREIRFFKGYVEGEYDQKD